MSKSNPHLPQEILIDICSRLPSKSIGKFRCSSKSWRSLLSTPNFIKSHLTRNKTHQQNLILITPSHHLHTICSPIKNDAVSRTLNLSNTWSAIVGSCNGLVLLANEKQEIFLVNPITQEQVKIPESPLALNKNESFIMHGFGYESCNDDYKIVTLSYENAYYNTDGGGEDDDDESDCDDTFVDVYSVKRGIWKRVNSSPYDHAVPQLASGAFVNGAIHWLACSGESGSGIRSVIAGFDLINEVFNEIPAPTDVDEGNFVFHKLVVLGGCLCMVDTRSSAITDFWILKEYGKEESWTKFCMSANYEWDIIKPLCFIGDEEVLFVTEGETLVVYNLKEKGLINMVVDGVAAIFIDGGTFAESLVSPAFGNQIEGGILP